MSDPTDRPGEDPWVRPDYGQQPAAYGESPYGAPPGQSPYGVAPGQSPYGAPPVPADPPGSIRTAVLLMRMGALLSLLSLVTTYFLMDQIREQVEETLAAQGTELRADAVDTAVAVGVSFSVFFGLVGVALWLWMAWANGRGRSWARIVATVLFGLSAVSFLFSVSQPQPVVTTALGVVNLVLGATIVFLLWKRESSDYYAAVSGQRRG